MTKDKQIEMLSNCFNEVIWMAIRYADGRHTFAPSTVRDVIRDFKKVHPEWKPKHDITIKKPTEDMIGGISFESDYLWDLFEDNLKDE
jgi:hypothetical protein